jgi:hypothetical protein
MKSERLKEPLSMTNGGIAAMIKTYKPLPYEGINPLPTYISNGRTYTLIAKVPNKYEITLARLTVGESVSTGNSLAQALFESFTDHGERKRTSRSRVNGHDREFVAVKNTMTDCGVEFHPCLPSLNEAILLPLGEWFMMQNPEITAFSLVSQSCH